MATPTTYVPAPPRTPRPNTSLHVLPVIDGVPGPHLSVQFIPDPCAFPNPLPQDCWVTMGPPKGTAKSFGDAGDGVASDTFGAYQGVECWLSGGLAEFSGVAERVLRNGEYRIVDGALAALLSSITTGGTAAGSAEELIGLLEAWLAAQVPAQGYIFLSPLAATYVAGAQLLVRNIDGTLETYLGTPVVIISEPSMATIAYASGPVTIWRGPIVSSEAPEPMSNTGRALAERLYSIAIECDAVRISWNPILVPGTQDPEPGTPLTMVLGSIPSSPIPDGTDVTAVVQTNQPITDPIHIWYSLNGGADTHAGEATQVDTLEFVFNADESITVTGDSVEVWATSLWEGNPVESNHITIEVI